ncbi:MAG: SprT family zinc-dependent metalloprotease [Alphaproteobacteria bacterium]|nr:SprT family zinc-dependent metalloprotease [Alphaproteobacteria bacterium]
MSILLCGNAASMKLTEESPGPHFDGFVSIEGEQIRYEVFCSKSRKRTVAFRFEYDNSLRVLAPMSATQKSIERVLQRRASWIVRERARREENKADERYTDGSTFTYLGHSCVLKVTRGAQALHSCRLLPHRFDINLPEKMSEQNQREEVRLELLLWVKKRARKKLKQRLDVWAKKLGVSYRRLLISNPRCRWGSCSADNIIRLNWRLMLAPILLLDYVVAHELCHVVHKNHSARFWKCLARAMPDCQYRRESLRSLERDLEI